MVTGDNLLTLRSKICTLISLPINGYSGIAEDVLKNNDRTRSKYLQSVFRTWPPDAKTLISASCSLCFAKAFCKHRALRFDAILE